MSQPLPTPPTTDLDRLQRIKALGYGYELTTKTSTIPCNLCESDRWTILEHTDRYGYPVQSTACARCGLVTINPRMTAAEYTRFYREIYRPLVSVYHGRQIDATTIQDEQRAYAAQMIGLLTPLVGDRHYNTLLDVGGSTGVVAAALAKAFGLAPTVIDPAPAEVLFAQSSGIRTVEGFIEDWDTQERFDLVGLFQTVDHLLDVAGTLGKLRRLISDQGLLVVDIVDFRAAYLKGRSLRAGLKVDHVFALTESTCEAYLARAGFSPLRKCYNDDSLHVAYVCGLSEPDANFLPDQQDVRRALFEMRQVQVLAGR